MTLDRNMSIADIVLEHPECAHVFSSFRIDFCCSGKTTVARACEEKHLDPETVFAALEAAVQHRADQQTEQDYRTLSTPALIQHIVHRHHRYLRDTMPLISAMASKVARVHGEHDSRCITLDDITQALIRTLYLHIDREEQALFPALLEAHRSQATVRQELETMYQDHLAVGTALDNIRNLTDDYSIPDWACTTFRTLFKELQNLQNDIHRHVHLENHVLMPRFIEHTGTTK